MPLFEVHTKLYFGRGERKNLPAYMADHGLSRSAVVIDGVLPDIPMFEELLISLRKSAAFVKVLSYTFIGEPTYDYLNSVKEFFAADDLDCVIGIGGGSVLDTAKGLAVLLRNPRPSAIELRGFPKGLNAPLPVIAIPTIAGTGSEVTYNAVFIDAAEKRKLGINVVENFPKFAIADPELSVSAPLKPSLSSGLDCLVHSLESFMSRRANFMTRPLSMEAFYYACRGIERLLKSTEDLDAREDLMRASYIAGIALFNSSAGPAGALSYPLGTFYHVPHGFAGAFFIRHVLDYNLACGYQDFAILHDRLFVNGQEGLSQATKAERVVRAIGALIQKAEVPIRLSAFGVAESDVLKIADQVKDHLWGAVEMNPVPITQEKLHAFLCNIL